MAAAALTTKSLSRRSLLAPLARLAPRRDDLRHVDVRRDGEDRDRRRRLGHPAGDRRLRRRRLMDADLALAGDRRTRRRSRGGIRLGCRSCHILDGDSAARAGAGELVEGDAELDRSPARDRRRDGTSRCSVVDGGPLLGGQDHSGGRSQPLGRRRRRPCLATCLAVAVRERRDRLSHGHGRALGGKDRVERPVPLGLVDHGGLVGLDLDQALASLESLARGLQPAEDDRVGHRVGELRHGQLAGRHGASVLELACT